MADNRTLLDDWRERGRDASRSRSLWVSASGIIAGLVVLLHIFGGGTGTVETLGPGARESVLLAEKQGARRDLIRNRLNEMEALGNTVSEQEERVTEYAYTLVQAKNLLQESGSAYPSDDAVASVADALVAGGSESDVNWILGRADGAGRVRALSRYYVLLRRGTPSNTAAAMALNQ